MNTASYLSKLAARTLINLVKKSVPPRITYIHDINIEEVFPGLFDWRIELQYLSWSYGHLTHDDGLILLASLVRHIAAKKVFEFGTFSGRTTVNLAINLSSDRESRVYSLDRAHLAQEEIPKNPQEEGYMDKTDLLRAVFRHKPLPEDLRERILLLEGDSRTFDLTQLYGQMDLVFVDGGHTQEVIASDTGNALKMVRPGGVIVWDDYGDYFPDVRDCLDALSGTHPLYRDKKTNLVVHRVAS